MVEMKPLHLMAMSAAASALLVLPSAEADAQTRPVVSGGLRITPHSPSHLFSWERGHGGFHGGFGNVWIVEQQVPVFVEREVVKEAPPPQAVPLPQNSGGGDKRKPYVIGKTYASLPGGCMKVVEQAASYYFCGGGEWYRQMGSGRGVSYKAVKREL
jgi:hypothetical protein